MKASHGCIRIQRQGKRAGAEYAVALGQPRKQDESVIWDDQGRQMYEPELPDSNLQLYRNPNGGSNYHVD